MKVKIVTDKARNANILETDGTNKDIINSMKAIGFIASGIEAGEHLREELRGKPQFNGLCGPQYDRDFETGEFILRYEDWESYDILSR